MKETTKKLCDASKRQATQFVEELFRSQKGFPCGSHILVGVSIQTEQAPHGLSMSGPVFIRTVLTPKETQCSECVGAGTLPSLFGDVVPCPHCGGTGCVEIIL